MECLNRGIKIKKTQQSQRDLCSGIKSLNLKGQPRVQLKNPKFKKVLTKEFANSQSTKLFVPISQRVKVNGTTGVLNSLTSSATGTQLKKISNVSGQPDYDNSQPQILHGGDMNHS